MPDKSVWAGSSGNMLVTVRRCEVGDVSTRLLANDRDN
jgi:hypothetical protein